jgi:hypothetical protein
VIYQERNRLRLLVRFRKAFIDRLLAEGEDSGDDRNPGRIAWVR